MVYAGTLAEPPTVTVAGTEDVHRYDVYAALMYPPVAPIVFSVIGDMARPVMVTVPAFTFVAPVEDDAHPGYSWHAPAVVGAGQFAAVPGNVYVATAPEATIVVGPTGAGRL